MLLRIGACEIDCDRRRVTRDGVEQPLPRKAFDLLLTLVEARPRVLDKELLIKAIWPNTFVADANLAILIGDLRAALGDSAQRPRLIKTHHRVGYSFIGEVTEVSARAETRTPSFILAIGRRRVLLFEGAVSVGRDQACDVVLDDPSVSRYHASLTVIGDQLTVKDNDSKNGTRIGRTRISGTQPVCPGQQLRFGKIEVLILNKEGLQASTLTTPDTAS